MRRALTVRVHEVSLPAAQDSGRRLRSGLAKLSGSLTSFVRTNRVVSSKSITRQQQQQNSQRTF